MPQAPGSGRADPDPCIDHGLAVQLAQLRERVGGEQDQCVLASGSYLVAQGRLADRVARDAVVIADREHQPVIRGPTASRARTR
jgi:hypothetical protein